MLALLNLSCGDDNVMYTSGGEGGLRINEVLYSTSNDQIELKNFGSEPVDVSTDYFGQYNFKDGWKIVNKIFYGHE